MPTAGAHRAVRLLGGGRGGPYPPTTKFSGSHGAEAGGETAHRAACPLAAAAARAKFAGSHGADAGGEYSSPGPGADAGGEATCRAARPPPAAAAALMIRSRTVQVQES